VPLKKVKATFTHGAASHVKFSTKKGNVRFLSLETGNYTLTSTMKGYVSSVKNNISINDEHILKLTIRLQKIIISAILELAVYDKETGNPLPDVHLHIVELNFTAITNEHGIILKSGIPNGTYQGIISAEGYKQTDFIFVIDKPKTLSLEFHLEKES